MNWGSSEQSIKQSGPLLSDGVKSGGVRFTICQADSRLLAFLFQERKLQPTTIDIYRSAITEKLGNAQINISMDENLNCLLDSFFGDRPKGQRGFSSWDLSLVLHHLKNIPFVSLKHLTLKTIFLLVLGCGIYRSEIHTWLNKNIQHQTYWRCLFSCPSFVAKNQLARNSSQTVAPVIIPALAPTLDRSRKTGCMVLLEPCAVSWTKSKT